MLSLQAFNVHTLSCNFPLLHCSCISPPCPHPFPHTHTPHPALIPQHVKWSSETQILHSRLSKPVCRRLQWAWTRLLHFWPRGDTLAGAPHYKCVVAPLAVRRNANNAPPAQGRKSTCSSEVNSEWPAERLEGCFWSVNTHRTLPRLFFFSVFFYRQ